MFLHNLARAFVKESWTPLGFRFSQFSLSCYPGRVQEDRSRSDGVRYFQVEGRHLFLTLRLQAQIPDSSTPTFDPHGNDLRSLKMCQFLKWSLRNVKVMTNVLFSKNLSCLDKKKKGINIFLL